MKKNLKKGFTLTELVIVIAVIAILAAVLIPVFKSLIDKANISADTQMAKQMNSVLESAGVQKDMQGVVDALAANGLGIEKLNPSTNGYRFVWEQKTDQILLLDENFNVVFKNKDYSQKDWELWLTVRSNNANQFVKTDKMNFNYFLANDFTGNFNITTLSSFSTGNNALDGNLSIVTDKSGEINIDGRIEKTITLNTPNATVTQNGFANEIDVQAVNKNSLYVNGFVSQLTVTKGHVVLNESSYIETLTIAKSANAEIENKTLIGKIECNGATESKLPSTVTFTNSGHIVNTNNLKTSEGDPIVNSTDPDTQFVKHIYNLAELEIFRDSVNNGATYQGIKVSLESDITLKDGWTPIGEFAREKENTSFSGTFDGRGSGTKNHTIYNLNNNGYVPNSKQLYQNISTQPFKVEYLYGFFGLVTNATIKNVDFSGVAINIENGDRYYGDKVGAIVGHSYGNLTLENCHVLSGTVSAYDGVGGLVGGAYGKSTNVEVKITGCSNNADITGNEKAAGIIGFTSGGTVCKLELTTNSGAVIVSSDVATANHRAHASGLLVYSKGSATISLEGCKNEGNISVNYTTFVTGKDNSVGVAAFAIANRQDQAADGEIINNEPEHNKIIATNSTNTGTLTLNGQNVTNEATNNGKFYVETLEETPTPAPNTSSGEVGGDEGESNATT